MHHLPQLEVERHGQALRLRPLQMVMSVIILMNVEVTHAAPKLEAKSAFKATKAAPTEA
jgi:hypothetical protein